MQNSSNLYEALIDNSLASGEEESKQYIKQYIPGMAEYSAIVAGNDISAINATKLHKQMAMRLGIATPLFVPKIALQNQLSKDNISNNASNILPSNIGYGILSAKDNGVNSRSYNESMSAFTRYLIDGLGNGHNEEQEGDNYRNFEEDTSMNDYVNPEYPEGFIHLLQILWSKNEKKMFSLSNPDGYFYLLYLKTLLKFFSLNFLVSGVTMCLVCYSSNLEKGGELDMDTAPYFDLFSLLFIISDSTVYYVSLGLTFFTTCLAYFFLHHFCNEMT